MRMLIGYGTPKGAAGTGMLVFFAAQAASGDVIVTMIAMVAWTGPFSAVVPLAVIVTRQD